MYTEDVWTLLRIIDDNNSNKNDTNNNSIDKQSTSTSDIHYHRMDVSEVSFICI